METNSTTLLRDHGVHPIDVEYLCTELVCEPANIEYGVHRTPRGSKLMAGLRGTTPTYFWEPEGGWGLAPVGWMGKQWA